MIGEKDLLTLFVHLRSYDQYYSEQEKFVEKFIQDMAKGSSSGFASPEDSIKYWKRKVKDPVFYDAVLFWPPWRYNDIVAFVKIYYDGGTRILAEIYHPNKRVSRQLKKKSFFWQSYGFEQGLGEISNKEIRKAVNKLITELDKFFSKKGWNLEYDKKLISCIDFEKLIKSTTQ